MALANLFTVSSFGTFFLFPLFIQNHGGAKTDIGIIMGAFSLAAVLCRPWISELVDRIGRKRSYTLGTLVMTLLPLAYLFFSGPLPGFYLPLLLVRVLHGVGLAICFTASFTYAADIIPEGRLNEGIGIFGITGLTGIAAGPIIAEQIIRLSGFPALFLVTSGMAFAGFLLHLPVPETYRPPAAAENQPSFFAILLRKRTLAVVILAFVLGFGLAASGNFVAPYAREQKLSLLSLFFITYSAAAILTRIWGGKFSDRVGEERMIPPALILTSVGLLTLTIPKGNLVLLTAGVLAGTGHGFLYPLLSALAIRNESIHIRGKVIGVFTGGVDAGAFFGSTILGYLGEHYGFRAIFLCAGLTLFAGLIYFKLWLSRRE